VSYLIVDIDGTLTTTGNTPRQDFIDYLKTEAADDKEVIIVSARPISRLAETRAWLNENEVPHVQVHLNDFSETAGPNVGLEFKKYKYELLIKQYGVDEIEEVIDNDPEVRAMAEALGLKAETPQAAMEDMNAEEPVDNGMQDNVAPLPSTEDRSEMDDVAEVIDLKEKETRSLPIGEFRLAEIDADGQRTFTGYASIWNSPSSGLPFEERIAPSAFKRSLARAAAGQKIIAFLFGHDEQRALATTASGRLQLTEDETGLRVEAKLDPADPDAAKVISMLTHESAAAGMSFGFQKVQDAWDGNQRTIKEANLFEVSILAAGGQTPAYPATLGLTAIRQVTAPKIGVEAEALMATLEAVKAGRELSTEEVAVIDAVRSKLAPKQEKVIDPSVAAAMLAIESAEGDAL
jgi:HK97 family phage prohead protease